MAAYVTVQEVRAEGAPAAISNSRISAAINRWQQFIERACRQFFDVRSATVELDGNDTDTLFMNVPIVTVTGLYINSDFTNVLPADRYVAFTQRGPVEDDRRNPKIKILRTGRFFDSPRNFSGPPAFLKGVRNQRIVGTFGFTEPDGSTPLLIKRALIKLVLKELALSGSTGLMAEVTAEPGPAGAVVRELTDGHEIDYADHTFAPDRVGLSIVTQDAEITAILDLYRGPIIVGVPGSPNWFLG